MSQNGNEKTGVKTAARNLEPYRRLVELQKQMIAMAQRQEQTRRRRDALHEQMVREAAERRHNRRGLKLRLQQSAARLLKVVSGFKREKAAPVRSNTNNHRYVKSH